MISTAPTMTNQGVSLLTRALGGEEITFTRFKIGNANLPAGRSVETLTDLIHPVMDFGITEKDDSQPGIVSLTGGFSTSDVEEDFTWRELGIFAKGEDNVEILYAYANDGANAGKIRAVSPDVSTEQTVTMIIAVGAAENITVNFVTPQVYIKGTYVGSGSAKRKLTIGFTPQAVILMDEWGQTWDSVKGVRGGMAVGAQGVRNKASASASDATTWNNACTALLIDTNGFLVNYYAGGSADANVSTNESDVRYHYIAFR